MTLMPKILVIDKDVFRATKSDCLDKFVENHFLVLPKVLYDEIVTTKEERNKLAKRFSSVMLSGGYICPASSFILQREAEDLCPYSFLPDLGRTNAVRKIFKHKKEFLSTNEIDQIQNEMSARAKLFEDFGKSLSNNLTGGLKNGFRKLSGFDPPRRIGGLMELVDNNNIHDVAIETMGHLTKSPELFCLDNNWVAWQYVRLRILLHYEHLFKMQIASKIAIEKIEHDITDMEYALLLSRADGLLSKDKPIQVLAKAAFPEKGIFESLDDVPDNYLCGWS